MKANSAAGPRRAFAAALFAALLAGFGAAEAGTSPLEGEWGGLDSRGATAQVIVTSGNVVGFFWGGDYRETRPARAYDGGARIEFTFATGIASLLKTPGGARLTIREVGRAPVSVDLKKD
jgi:hypothetical protein